MSTRRTFFGEMASRDATRAIFRPSASQIFGIRNAAKSSEISRKVRSPVAPCDQALSVSSTVCDFASLDFSATAD